MKFGVISDLHLYNKRVNLQRAFAKLQGVDCLLIVGDIADRADASQYALFMKLLEESGISVPLYCVSGNHDNPARDDANYRKFEGAVNSEYADMLDESGGFYRCFDNRVDIIGLNPVYHQKQFFFPNRGQQLDFLEQKLSQSASRFHIILCHPPLIAHNPQRGGDMSPYIAGEQDRRLQRIIDENRNIIFISGHTHVVPDIEYDAAHDNLYINNGSICPTSFKDDSGQTRQGNVTLLEISEEGVSVVINGIHSETVFADEFIKM